MRRTTAAPAADLAGTAGLPPRGIRAPRLGRRRTVAVPGPTAAVRRTRTGQLAPTGVSPRTVRIPAAKKPSCAVRFDRPGESPPPMPSSHPAAMAMNPRIAATLIEANQNSNSP
jgi:hypothetical protein